MRNTVIIAFYCLFIATSCQSQSKEINVIGKTFESVGYAKDQLSPEDIKANPVFANTFVTTRAKIEFVNDTLVRLSYFHYNQGTKSNECNYAIKDGIIITKNYKDVTFMGQKFKLEGSTIIKSLNGQLKDDYVLVE